MALRLHHLLPAAGLVLVVLTTLGGSGFSAGALPFALWGAVPYGVLWLLARWLPSAWPLACAGAAALAAELGVRASVYVWPRGSTAGIALLFSPIFITVLVVPAGLVAGLAFGRLWRRSAAGRLAVAIAAPAALGLLALDLARPELFPTAVLARRALLERVGPPRVALGGDRFESVPISSAAAWHVVGQLDADAADEIAVVDHDGADVFDASTLSLEAHVAFGGEPGQVWTAFSTLVRLPDERLAIVDTGGGYSPTRVKDLSGVPLWAYHPDAELPPTAMQPADLDGDGEVELYAASSRFVARMDAEGGERWKQPAGRAQLLALLPRAGPAPAWVVGVEYGRRVLIWDAQGRRLAELPAAAADTPIAAVDSSAGRVLVLGGHTARGYDIEGRQAFGIPLGDFTLSQAAGVRLTGDGRPWLALVGAADRDARRWRLLVVDPGREIVYDEVLDHPPRVAVARRGDGPDLLVVSGGRAVRALRVRR